MAYRYSVRKGVEHIKTKTVIAISAFGLALGGGAMSLAVFGAAHATSSTVVITGDTAAVENDPGWMFNRDLSTSTPYEFNTDQHSIGSGSIYVKPIGSNASDKFVAENFVHMPVSSLSSISYDLLVAGNGTSASADQFYLNVYANVVNDNKFYDCRFDYAPSTASTSSFTTATFLATDTPVNVKTSGTTRVSPGPCPTTLAGMPAGSYIRMFSISVGDTSTSDVGLAGYLDNVVVTGTADTTTYDFEVIPSPAITYPTNNAVRTTAQQDKIDWSDVSGATSYEYRAFSDSGYSSLVYASGPLAASEIPTPGTPEGVYYVQVRALNANSTSAWSNDSGNPFKITIDNTAPIAPTLISPADNSTVTSHDFTFTWSVVTDPNGPVTYQWEASLSNTVDVNGAFVSPIAAHNLTTTSVYSPGTPDNVYYWHVRALDAASNASAWVTPWKVTVNTVVPPVLTYPTTKDSCKANNWKTFTGVSFKNQGDCVSYVATGGRNLANGPQF